MPPDRVEFDLVEDGEPPQVVAFPASAGTDSRYFRAFAFKPTREGTFTLAVRAFLAGALVGWTTCPDVVVSP